MNKQQFLSGTPFTFRQSTYKGDSTYYYNADAGCISRQSRSCVDNRVVLDEYECNLTKIGKTTFAGFTFVMTKKVVVRYKFSDLVQFQG